MKYDVLIVGAGASGLMTAYELSSAGYSVCILEAMPTAGGRINTIIEDGFDQPVETGAEFIHGNLPLTFDLLKRAGIEYIPVKGDMIPVNKGVWQYAEDRDDQFGLLFEKLREQENDTNLLTFLDQHFPSGEYDNLRESATQMAEGFDLADISKISVLSLKEEWAHDIEEQYRVEGGYRRLINFLTECVTEPKVQIYYNSVVNKIDHQQTTIKVYTADDNFFEADKVIVAVSPGVINSSLIEFSPVVKMQTEAISQIGFGSVVKILIQFKSAFWNETSDNIGFILSDEFIPTWWTQDVSKNALLTGWLGGPKAFAIKDYPDEQMLTLSLESLSSIFKKDMSFLKGQVKQFRIMHWDNQPFTKGGYSYNTVNSAAAKEFLSKPIDQKIYFAGEACYNGESQGTVEAALQSGYSVARLIIDGKVSFFE